MDMGIHANGGIGRINSKIGLMMASAVLEYPMETPSKIPVTVAMENATPTNGNGEAFKKLI